MLKDLTEDAPRNSGDAPDPITEFFDPHPKGGDAQSSSADRPAYASVTSAMSL